MPAWTFRAEVFRWPGDAAWHFAQLPADIADELRDLAGEPNGFGSVRVSVTVGGTTWATSVFPDKDSGSYVLPVKKPVRAAEGIADGDEVSFDVRLAR